MHTASKLLFQAAIVAGYIVGCWLATKITENPWFSWQCVVGGLIGATIGHETGNLTELCKTKGEGHYYLAKSVDNHGLIEALQYFKLLEA